MKQLEFFAGSGLRSEKEPMLINANLHAKIRDRLDPSAEFLSDADIQKIMQMHFGHEESIIRQCMLGISLMAEEAGQLEVAVRFRRLLFTLEAGNFDIHANPVSVPTAQQLIGGGEE